MGKLIKNHWARLLILTAAAYQSFAAIMGFFWPKLFFDFLTTTLDPAVRPIPILQIINLFLGLATLAFEWPLLPGLAATVAIRKPIRDPSTADTTKAGLAQQAKDSKPPRSRIATASAIVHRSIEARLIVYPLCTLAAILLYQATNAALYYIIGMIVYFWALAEGERVMPVPWTLPRRVHRKGLANV